MIHYKLYKQDSKGKTRSWQVETDGARYRTIAGLEDGKSVVSEWTDVEGKNIGRSNETTPEEQCQAEVNSLYTKKMDKHYVTDLGAIKEERAYFEVMLANDYTKLNEKKLAKLFPPGTRIFTQPKLDGVRGPTSSAGTFSRGGNEFKTVRFLQEQLQDVWQYYRDLVLDGELYNHDYRDDFNEIISCIKREKPDEADIAKARELAQFHVYDCFSPWLPNATFAERQEILDDVFKYYIKEGSSIHRVRTDEVTTLVETDPLFDEYQSLGYEGQMIRGNDPYKHKRCDTLLKRKDFMDDEFEIVELQEGKGNWSGAVKHVECKLPDGRTFGTGVRGTKTVLTDLWQFVQAGETPYKTAKVRFQHYTPDGVPRFGVTVQFYEGDRDD